jgi:citrate lyase beta subunit
MTRDAEALRGALESDVGRERLARLAQANRAFAADYPGERGDRQPVHTVYGGAHLFTADIAKRMGAAALQCLNDHAPDFVTFARALRLDGAHRLPRVPTAHPELRRALETGDGVPVAGDDARLALAVYERVIAKLEREPVEDYRVDFEDGYGNRPDAEEDGHAEAVGREMARGLRENLLPPFVGIRIKPLSDELAPRSLRTLERFAKALVGGSGGELPANFCVTLAKVTCPEQVATLADVLGDLERSLRLKEGALEVEIMIETPQSLLGPRGEIAIPAMVAAARGRLRGAHFGIYDYTASLGITAAHQVPEHAACDFARHVMQVSLAGTGVTISDGASNVMPVGPHRASTEGPPLTHVQLEANRRAVHRAWRIHYDFVRRSLRQAYYQGWDLNPAQLPTRYAAVFAFYLEARAEAAQRLSAFVERAAQATLLGSVFDDAATGQGLLNFFLRGLSCGALTEAETLATGLSLEELRTRSFAKILNRRREAGR